MKITFTFERFRELEKETRNDLTTKYKFKHNEILVLLKNNNLAGCHTKLELTTMRFGYFLKFILSRKSAKSFETDKNNAKSRTHKI